MQTLQDELTPAICHSWYKARHGSLMVAAAADGAAAVRKADPAHYPAAPHAYFRLGEHELTAPLLCAVCFERVESNNLFQVSDTVTIVSLKCCSCTVVSHAHMLQPCHATVLEYKPALSPSQVCCSMAHAVRCAASLHMRAVPDTFQMTAVPLLCLLRKFCIPGKQQAP